MGMADSWLVTALEWAFSPLHLGAIICPSLLVVGASTVRWTLKLPFTSWADALLALVAFDATVIIDGATFQGLFANPRIGHFATGIHLVFFSLAAICWLALVYRAETALANATVEDRRGSRGLLVSGTGVLAVAVLLSLHIAAYRI
jgi:hypothetical protein